MNAIKHTYVIECVACALGGWAIGLSLAVAVSEPWQSAWKLIESNLLLSAGMFLLASSQRKYRQFLRVLLSRLPPW